MGQRNGISLFEQAHRTVCGLERAVFSDLGKRRPRQYHYLHIYPVKGWMHYPRQLLEKWGSCACPSRQVCCKGSHHPTWRADPESSGSRPQLPRGAEGHLTPPLRDTRPRSATSHLSPSHAVTRQPLPPCWKLPAPPLQNHHLILSQL